ncbi:sucrose phosphorylase [Gordonia polyisoprenivorans]|uniref:sucrose phosphorylase n=1 Tax=Gordonia polyisoprenivorans TaxID=84595 RepID=UPI002233FE87|nr:sucrose phosphorylase [Gordonia polyisoprenivorans]
MQNTVHLIAYADRFGGSLAGLTALLRGPFDGVFGGVHVLPFFTPFDGADAGFDPVDHTRVDPRLGSWAGITDLATTHEVMADQIINHVSADSAQFRDVVAHGNESDYAPMFLTLSSVFPNGATEDQLTAIYRPRPGLPFTAIALGGRVRYVWTTFTAAQIDIDVRSAPGRAYLDSILDAATDAGVSALRLDAVGYAIKTPGTSCFMTPETIAFIDEFAAKAHTRGVEVLVEVHSHFARQIAIARSVDRVYDFALPALVLHTLYTADAQALVRWLQIRPDNAVTVLDTHDGIGVVDVGPDPVEGPGLLTPVQVHELVEEIHRRTGGTSRLATGTSAANVDIYQVNSTFYDALGRDDERYLSARTLQLFVPGIPQVYYVGLLAGGNDMELLDRTGVGRDINRHHYTHAEIAEDLRRPVVGALLALCRFRNTHPAFDGPCETTLADGHLRLLRRGRAVAGAWARADIDLATGVTQVAWGDGEREWSAPVAELASRWGVSSEVS